MLQLPNQEETSRGTSTEPHNLKTRNSFGCSGLIHHKTAGMEPVADGKRGRGGDEVEIQAAKAGHCLRADHRQQGRPSHSWQHLAHDLKEQVPSGCAHAQHLRRQRHPTQPEACDCEEEAHPPTKSS